MKRTNTIILLIITAVICSLVIFASFELRERQRNDIISDEILRRLEVLSAQTDTISMVEVTPFQWSRGYGYGSYSTEKAFDNLLMQEEVKPCYQEAYSELQHRLLFYNNDNLVFDTQIINDWYIFSKMSKGIQYDNTTLFQISNNDGFVILRLKEVK